MTFLIRTIQRKVDGTDIVREREVDTDTLGIGRSSENELHLPDLAVEQNHARIEPADGGKIRVSSVGSLGFTLNGGKTTEALVDPRQGAELGFGTYRLTISQEGSTDGATPVMVTVAQAPEQEGAGDAIQGFALASALPSKRVMAWGGLAAILIAFLTIPVVSHLTRDRIDDPDIDRQGAVLMDASWSSGALSVAHHDLEDNCEACHVDAFVSVQDETCKSCHTEILDHADISRQVASTGPMEWGEAFLWEAAEAFGKEGAGSCTMCHSEHEAAPRLETTSQQFCAACHDGMDAHLTDTKLANAGDFARDHPQFQVALFTGPGEDSLTRVSQSEAPREYTGLRFPHALHMQERGGVAQMASRLGAKAGYGDALVCADCHTLTDDRKTFTDVNMEEDCEACHSLVVPGGGSLSHGSVAQLRRELSTMATRAPRRIAPGRTRPGEFARGGLYYQNFGAPVRRYTAITRALQPGGVCGDCHLPTTTNGQLDVMPVRDQERYFVNGYFDHRDHLEEDCTTCHAGNVSNASADLLMPTIAVCQDCHVGKPDEPVQVALAWPYGEERRGFMQAGSTKARAALTPAAMSQPASPSAAPPRASPAAMRTTPIADPEEVASSCAMCHAYHPVPAGELGGGSGQPDMPHQRDHTRTRPGEKRGDVDRVARLGRETG